MLCTSDHLLKVETGRYLRSVMNAEPCRKASRLISAGNLYFQELAQRVYAEYIASRESIQLHGNDAVPGVQELVTYIHLLTHSMSMSRNRDVLEGAHPQREDTFQANNRALCYG